MKKIKDWFRNKMVGLMLSVSNVEKNALNQTGELLSTDTGKFQRLSQGLLSDSLINGEVTQEVLNLKWRTYKILKASEGLTTEITGYDKDGMPITKTTKKDNKRGLSKVKFDTVDPYPLQMVLDNSEIVLGGNDGMENQYFNIYDTATINYDDNNEAVSASHGEIDGTEYFASNKADKPIKIIRETAPNFYLENYTKKLNVRKIDETKRLLEFYVSQYPDEYDRTTRLFISAIKKQLGNSMVSPMLEINGVEFVTYKTLGVGDYLEFSYDIDNFDKIIEFNGYYVVKFIATVKVDGRDITEIHRVDELDKKYENKEKK